MNIFKKLGFVVLGILIAATPAYAVSILIVQQGGTGVGTFTPGLIAGNGTNPLYGGISTTTASCAGSASCSAFTVLGSSPVTITASGGGSGSFASTTPWTPGFLPYIVSDSLFKGIATSSLAFSGPFIGASALGALVGGSNSTITWTGLATTSQPASSNLLVSNGGAGVYGIATTSVSCSGSVTCSSFTAIGASPITISAAAAASSPIATSTNEVAGNLAYWTSTSGTPALLGQVATGTVLAGTGISVTAGQAVIGSGLTVTNTGVTAVAVSAPLGTTGATGSITLSCATCITSIFGKTWDLITNTFGVSALAPTTTVPIAIQSTATSTFLGGIESWTALAAPYLNATSTTATSTFAGNIHVLKNLQVDGALFAPVTIVSSGNATINGALTVTGQTTLATSLTGLLLGTSGVVSAFGGTTCTNQFVRALSASGAATCATVNLTSDVTGVLPIANGGTNASSFGTSNGITAFDGTRLVNFSGYTLTSTLATLPNASTTNASVGTWFQLPNGATPAVAGAGSIAYDTSPNGNLVIATTSGATGIAIPAATTTLYAYTATTSPIVSGTTMNLPAHFLRQVATGVICKVSSGTSLVINLSDSTGASDTNAITCTTTETQYAFTTNNVFAAYAGLRVEYGTKTGTTGDISVRIIGYRTE